MSKCNEQTTTGRLCRNEATHDGLCTQHRNLRVRSERVRKRDLRAAHHVELLGIIRCLLEPDKYVVTQEEMRRAYERGLELLP